MKEPKDIKYHTSGQRRAIIFVNHGTPDAPSYFAVQRYLREFLSDPKVVKLPRCLWLPILYGFILPFRPFSSAVKYQRIWTADGSPFQLYHQSLTKHMSRLLNLLDDNQYIVRYAMRYGNPSLTDVIDSLSAEAVHSIDVLPLFPQYAESMTGSIFKKITETLSAWPYIPEFNIKLSYHDNHHYIDEIAKSIETYWQQAKQRNRLVISFHSLPQKTLKNGDPYYCLCQKTGRLIAEKLGLDKSEYDICYQSRFGREPWLQPYTQDVLLSLAENGHQEIDVVCPGFSMDCLETIDEVAYEFQELVEEQSTCQLNYIPCLNDSDAALRLYGHLLGFHSLTK
tara:strand:+ start:1060 stop:2076 length:1017 start_codon:yes stop_codon:yes gene_type:complete